MTAEASLAERKAAVLADLRKGRELVIQTLNDTKQDEIYKASQWGVADAINHMVGGLSYHDMIARAINEDRPRFPAWPTPEESCAQLKAKMNKPMHARISYVQSRTE